VSIVLVLAASAQGVSSNITVSYNAEGVAAKVSANYAIVPIDSNVAVSKTAMTTNGGGQEIIFNLSAAQKTETISPAGDIMLDPQHQTVVFEYVFENLSEQAFSLTLKEAQTSVVNMTETFLAIGRQLEPSEYTREIINTTLSPQAITSIGQKVYVYIMAKVTNENLTASYSVSFNWDMIAKDTIGISLSSNGSSSVMKIIPTSEEPGIAMPVLSGVPTNGSKVFLGYYTAASAGTKYIDRNGTSAHAADLTAGTTLYAQFSEETVVMSGTSVTGMTEAARALGEVVIPDTTTVIAANAFENETSLTEVTFAGAGETESYADGSALTTIGANAFKGCTGIERLEIVEGVTRINANAFENCTNLRYLTIPKTVNVFEDAILKGCTKFIKLELPARFVQGRDGGPWMFAGISSLFIESSLDDYGDIVYYNASIPQIDNLILNAGTIPYSSFASLTEIKNIILDGVTGIESFVFFGTTLNSLMITKNHVNLYNMDNIFENANISDIYFEGTESEFENYFYLSGYNINDYLPSNSTMHYNYKITY